MSEEDKKGSKVRTATSREVKDSGANQPVILSGTMITDIKEYERKAATSDDDMIPVSEELSSVMDDENDNQTDIKKSRGETKMPEQNKPNKLVYLVGGIALAASAIGNYSLYKKTSTLEAELQSKPAVEQVTSLQKDNASLQSKFSVCEATRDKAESNYAGCQKINDVLQANPLPFKDSWYDRIRKNIRNEAEIEVIVNEFLKMTREKHLLLQNPSNLFHVMCSEYRSQKEYKQLHEEFDYSLKKIFDVPDTVPRGKHIVFSY
ncbi:MAG: hypothetical protein ABIA37_03500 [Candidatus Woesearchaeota archaeon]